MPKRLAISPTADLIRRVRQQTAVALQHLHEGNLGPAAEALRTALAAVETRKRAEDDVVRFTNTP